MKTVTAWFRGRSELGLAALLGAFAVIIFVDTATMEAVKTHTDPLGPTAMPYIVGSLLAVCSVLLVRNVLRGGHGESDDGEDVDLSIPSDWRTVIPLIAAFVANIMLIDVLGWVISGTILFWGSVWALGSRHYVRDGLISVGMALGTFYGFYAGLGINLPAGLLKGVL